MYGDINVGVIGCGNIAKAHINAYQELGVKIAVVCDVNTKLAHEIANSINANEYHNYLNMLEEQSLDAISICTPPAFHKEIALAFLKKDVSILCEKPLARTVKEAKMMKEADKASQGMLIPAFCHRFYEPLISLKEMIDSGKFGRIINFRNRFAHKFKDVDKTWFSNKKIAGGGSIIDTSVHSIDIFRYLIGEIVDVQGMLNSFLGLEVEDTSSLVVKADSGTIGTIEASWVTPVSQPVIEIYGTKGTGIIDYVSGSLKYKLEGSDSWSIESNPDKRDRFTNQAEHFINCVLGNQKPIVTVDDGLKGLEIMERVYKNK